MICVLLVRHGESTWNAERRWQGQADPPLSGAGERQAREAVAGLRALGDLEAVRASPLRRARRTAELLAAGAGLPHPVPDDRLMERAAGAWEGLTHGEIDERWPGSRHGTWRPEGYESDAQLRARAQAALSGLGDGRTLVVAHEGLIRALDGEPAPLANLGARWLEVDDGVLRPAGARFSLRT